jgi:hypothetical protein
MYIPPDSSFVPADRTPERPAVKKRALESATRVSMLKIVEKSGVADL